MANESASQKIVNLFLPWPPSVNHYWHNFRGRTVLTEKGRHYKKSVATVFLASRRNKLNGRIRLEVIANPPDNRKRDLDNIAKALLDALAYAGLYQDDSQIDFLSIARGIPVVSGNVFISAREI